MCVRDAGACCDTRGGADLACTRKEEASIHMSMKIDEISASFFGKISSQRGMKIKKRGRNGKIRHIVMYMITNDTELEYIPETKSFYSNSCSLVYKSFWGTAKKFDLENINMLTLEAAAETTTSSSSSSLLSSSFDRISSIMGRGISSGSSSAFVGRNVSSSQQQRSHVNNLQSVGDSKSFTTYDDDKSVSNNSDCGYSTDNRIMMTSSKQSVTDSKMQTKRHQQQRQKNNDHHKNNVSGKLKSMMPYIRITNADRYIDLQFETLADHHGCLESLQKFCQTKYSQRGVAGMMGGLVITDD